MKNFSYDNFELKEIQKLEGHTGKVLGIAWKVDTGVWGFLAVMASWSDDKTVRIWEENLSGFFVCKAVLEASSTVRSCAWSQEFYLLAAGCSDATTVIWKNVGDHAYERIYTLKGHENEVRSVSWDKDGILLATCGGDKSIWIWEALPGDEFDCASVLQGHTEDVKIVQWDDRITLFSGSSDNTIKVWEETIYRGVDWPCIETLGESDREHTSAVLSLSFSKQRRRMVSCSDDLTIKIWNCERHSTELWSHICTLSGYHDTTIFAVDWLRELLRAVPKEEDQDPEIFASAGADDAIRIFIEDKDNEGSSLILILFFSPNLSQLECLVIRVLRHTFPYQRASSKEATVDGLPFKLLLKKEKAHETNINSVKWHSGDKRRLASASDDGTVKIWEFVCPWPAGRIDP